MANRLHGGPTRKSPEPAAAGKGLPPLFPYIWRNSRRQQVVILAIVLLSLPFYFLSLDLPRSIVNDAIQGRAFQHGAVEAPLFAFNLTLPAFLGGGAVSYPGVTFSRIAYLMVLSSVFMVLVLVNGAFRYVINMQKGKLGEALLRRLRLDLFNLLLRFRPEAVRNVRSAEVATIIRDEVEPIGGFVGDAYIQPAFLGSQALTALGFILLQSPLLGILAAAMVLVQGAIIPRLRREQLRLGRQRQARSRSLAGHIGEIVDGIAEVSNHGTAAYERQKITSILDDLFWIRYRLYGRKFMVKFINSVLAQVTPFLFYALGGYFALRGSLDIGQLVAVIAAYRDLPPPIKELIDWDQQRQDVEVKYEQILEQFSLAELPELAGETSDLAAGSTIAIEALRVHAPSGDVLLDNANLSLPVGAHVLLTGSRGEGFITLAQVLARRLTEFGGRIQIAGQDIAAFSPGWIGENLGYLGPDCTIFGRSLRDNIVYSLRAPPAGQDLPLADLWAPDLPLPSGSTGSRPGPGAEAAAASVDLRRAGAADARELDDMIVTLLREIGLADAVYGFGLSRKFSADPDPDLARRLVDCRRRLVQELAATHLAELIEPFDPARFNRYASIGENLFFGVPVAEGAVETLIEDPQIAALLAEGELDDSLLALGLKVAATMVEIFSRIASDHVVFERFSFISSSDLPRFAEIASRAGTRGTDALAYPERRSLLMLAFHYVETRHRLGLLTEALAEEIVRARRRIMALDPARFARVLEFHAPDRLCPAAPLRDNLLFGRIDHAIAGAEERVMVTLHKVVHDCGLEPIIYQLGLDQEAGPGGRLLLPTHKCALALARCLIKRPKILILDQLDLMFPESQRAAILDAVRRRMAGRTLIVAMRDATLPDSFDVVVTTRGNRIESVTRPSAPLVPEETPPETLVEELAEIQALRDVPMFAALDTPRLKLIAFTCERVSFGRSQVLFRQGDVADAAYIILSGTTDIFMELADERLHLSTTGRHSIIGEMGLISGAPRSATVVATTEVVALKIAKDIFLNLIAELPAVALVVMRDQVRRLGVAEERLTRLMQRQPTS
ncbi:cyclic nucleotide-binding domain-containing protein [Labrys sp. KNU-23]|uniref:cyclic nucleotide-binding domain-containing protein n=1 Tax=Labrys sp. KNU-23 TaxID=2789216 RepID=UPI0011EEFBF7|nr:cyclic nucleotide-binding domain-containing protein [Labrys sp. KNU-23]QEN86321.1 cyclic nucleotide-binding domain-containing protein [Labrys sp. KNU-23]